MLTVSAREANQRFSKILDVAAGGEEVTITRRGKPVAKLIAIAVEEDAETEAARREKERDEFLACLAIGFEGSRLDDWTRDELYDERLEHPWQPVA